MTNAPALWLPDVIADEGVIVKARPGWEKRCARRKTASDTGNQRTGQPYPFTPVAVLNHHDALNEQTPVDRCLDIMENGRPDLPGPLCNLWLDDDGLCYVISAGNANHAGKGSSAVLDRVKRDLAPLGDARVRNLADDTIGNQWFIGIEVNGADGILTPKQQDALVRINAAICRHELWTPNRCIHHREWTKRKPDMAWRGLLRQLVADHMEDDMFTPEDRAKLDRLYDAHFTDVPAYGVTGIQKAVMEIGYSVAGVDLPKRPSLLKKVAAKVGVKV